MEKKAALVTGSAKRIGAAIVDMLAQDGWDVAIHYQKSAKEAKSLVEKVKNYGVARVIYTDIDRDGTNQGPNYLETYKLAERFDVPFIISGGISSIDDVNKVIKDNKKIEGIIIGKAIYENKINLSDLGKI